MNYDFSGWATKNDFKCSDGRTIREGAFRGNDGMVVPLVFSHVHDSVDNVLGHALLENRPEGVYAYGTFNNTSSGQKAKEMVRNGDIRHLSIYANQLTEKNGDVLHGNIRELSLVLAGANPGALIDVPYLEHSMDELDFEGIVYTDENILVHSEDGDYYFDESDEDGEYYEDDEEDEDEIEHADFNKSIGAIIDTMNDEQKNALYYIVGDLTDDGDDDGESDGDADDGESDGDADGGSMSHADSGGKTIRDIINTMNDEQKNALYAIVGELVGEDEDDEEGDNEEMKHNVFDNETQGQGYLSHDDMDTIFKDAKSFGSLRDAVEYHETQGVLMHAGIEDDDMPEQMTATYGIDRMNYLFPEARLVTNMPPEFIKRDMDWVQKVMGGVHHTPFSRIKSMFANITMDEARAKGYTKGHLKKEEVFTLLRRTTDPQTIYKKQKMDRDDMLDITSFDVVSWLKSEMRMMLDEEIARAILIGDGRSGADEDHISEDHIRPIWTDKELYSVKCTVPKGGDGAETARNFIDTAIRSRKLYKGSGQPTLFTTEDFLTEMLLLEDGINHKLYKSEAELATTLRVKDIVTVPVMEDKTKDGKVLAGIIVNLTDYNVGADKGGEVNMFDDFDIDYNQQKYLIETRISGALIKPYSALILEVPTE